MARERHHESDCMLAGSDVVAAGCIHDDDALLGSGIGIDVFITHAGPADDL